MEESANTACKVASYAKSLFQSITQCCTFQTAMHKIAGKDALAFVVNEFSKKGFKKHCQNVCTLLVFVFAALFFYATYKTKLFPLRMLKNTVRLLWDFLAVFLCIAIVVNILK